MQEQQPQQAQPDATAAALVNGVQGLLPQSELFKILGVQRST